MYCKKCGFKLDEDSRFCSRCGLSLSNSNSSNNKTLNDDKVIFSLKPKFDLLYKVLKEGGSLLLILLIFSYSSLFFLDGSLMLAIILLIVILYLIIKLPIEKKQYDNLVYNFYKTKVEYKDGFINKEEKELKYKYIREVVMSQNILERFCGIGTIKIFTSASTGYNSRRGNMGSQNGIYIHCVPNVSKQYKRIKQIINQDENE